MSTQPIETPRAAAMRIIAGTAQEFGVSVDDVVSKSRMGLVVSARHTAMRRVKAAFPHMSSPQIANLFGRSEHTVVLYALGKTKSSRSRVSPMLLRPNLDPAVRRQWREIVQRVALEVAMETHVPVREILGSLTDAPILAARRETIARVHQRFPNASRTELARIMGLNKSLAGYDMGAKAVAAE